MWEGSLSPCLKQPEPWQSLRLKSADRVGDPTLVLTELAPSVVALSARRTVPATPQECECGELGPKSTTTSAHPRR